MTFDPLEPDRRDLPLAINRLDPSFLTNLEDWQRLGLIHDEQLREFCATSLSCPLFVLLPIHRSHPNLLAGLDQLVAQEVLSEDQVLRWCQTQLSEPCFIVDRLPVTQPVELPPEKTASRITGVAAILQSLMDEISVMWLLFLGVFLVVVSSAVLAASQWDTVSAAGQYGILWAYTFAFWGVSHWLGQRKNLQLTAHTLQLTALLIIPVNFWMIDSFQLVQGGLSLLVALVAGVVLSGLMAHTLNPRDSERWGKRGWVVFVNLLLLSWLHWGWRDPWVAPVAIYVGIIVTGICVIWTDSEYLDGIRARPPNRYSFTELLALTPLYGMLLLLLRGLWIAQLPLTDLGLALGLIGGLFCWMSRRSGFGSRSWWLAGILCLLWGRVVTSEIGLQGQAVFITAIALGVFCDRLLRSWQPWLVWLAFLTGLQGLYPLYALVPVPIQEAILAKTAAIVGSKGLRPAVLSFLVLPYWWLTLGAASFLQARRPQLVPLVNQMALGLGLVLTLFSLANPPLRTLFLLCVMVTLLLRLKQWFSPVLMGLTHSVILGAIASGIDTAFPNLAVTHWAMLCFVAMLGEFGVSVYGRFRWHESAWWAGLILAIVGYVCLLSAYSDGIDARRIPLETMTAWLIPVGLTGLGYIRTFSKRTTAQLLGFIFIFAVQLLCLPYPHARTFGFGVAVVLVGSLSRVMRRFFPVVATIGWGLAFGVNGFYSYVPSRFYDWFWVFLSLLGFMLAGASGWLRPIRQGRLVMYRRALFAWSCALTALLTGGLSLVVLVVFSDPEILLLPMQVGAAVTAIATFYQFWLSPRATRLYLSAIAVEITILLLSWLSVWPREAMAIGTLIAGLASLLLYRNSPRISQRHWIILPLIFAWLGCVLGHYDFLAHTGLYTMGASLLLLLVGRREPIHRGITYVGIAGFSFGGYELLVYQILQADGEHAGDAWVIFAGVATVVAIADRIFTRGLTRILRLSPTQFLPVAHLHWLAASLFLLTALVAPMRVWAEVAWIVLLLILATYAMIAGRIQSGFLYAGVAQGLGAIAFGLVQVIPLSILGYWGGAIAVGFAALLYYFPWSRYQWDSIPEQRMAMILPVGVVILSFPNVGLTSVLCAGAWYFWISQRPNLLRLSYLGLVFGNWALFRLVERWWTVTPMWMAILLGCSVLLVVQWEPLLQHPERREVRHWLRCLALGLMSVVALYESDGYLGWSLGVVLSGLLLGVAGLALRVRSFLYVGTLLFGVKVLWLLWAFVSDHSFLLWALGIVLGIVLIWVAATFESRRTQAIAFLDYWVDALQHWQ